MRQVDRRATVLMSRAARNSVSVASELSQAPPVRRRAAPRSTSGKGNKAGDGPAGGGSGAHSGRQQAALAGSRPAQRSRSRQRPAGTAGVSESPDALIRACQRQTRSLRRDRSIEHRDAARQAQQAGAVRRSASARRPKPARRSGTAATEAAASAFRLAVVHAAPASPASPVAPAPSISAPPVSTQWLQLGTHRSDADLTRDAPLRC